MEFSPGSCAAPLTPRKLIPALLLCTAVGLHAQTATLVKDINPREYHASSSPSHLVAMGNKVFFSGSEGSSGREMWVTDGTAARTELLADACSGECDSDPAPVGNVGSILFFAATAEDGGSRLWRSDGTRAGTFPLTESGVSLHGESAVSEHLLIFIGCTAAEGCEPWASDGTRAGTRLVKDLTPGPDNAELSLIALGGKVLVLEGEYGRSQTLWATDGTAAGTVLVKDLGAGRIDHAVIAGSHLFLTVHTQAEGTELWASDGTAAGTLQVTRFFKPEPINLNGAGLQVSGRRVYFVADDGHGSELWRSDGTVAGTQRLTNFAFNYALDDSRVAVAAEIGDLVVFIATDGQTLPRLWTSQGSPASVKALPVPCGGACEFLSFDAGLFEGNGRIFFTGSDGVHGKELWTTDGTAAGTRMVRDICPGTCAGLGDTAFVAAGGKLFFQGTDAHGRQLWQSDGTTAGTRPITDFRGQDSYVVLNPNAGTFAVSGRRIFFIASTAGDVELWMSDGGDAPRLVADVAQSGQSAAISGLVASHGRLYFTANDGARRDVWTSDGSADGTVAVTSGLPFDFSGPLGLTLAGESMFFLADVYSTAGPSLWRTDGTAGGTVKLLADRPLANLTALGGVLFFSLTEGIPGQGHDELWRSDGTPAGTRLLVAFPEDVAILEMRALGATLYFLTSRSGDSPELWQSDGTAAGTFKLAALTGRSNEPLRLARLGPRTFFLNRGALWSTDGTPGGTGMAASLGTAPARELLELGGSLYLLAEGTGGRELWRSDGTAARTIRLAVFPGKALPDPTLPHLTAAAGRLFFNADDGVHGEELWTSDGTVAGTVLVRDVVPGPGSSRPSWLTPAGGRLFFAATDGTHGFELWQTDGTAAGTRMVQDIGPEAVSSSPNQLTVAGDRLFFNAFGDALGEELWTLPLAGPSGCLPSPSRLCLGGGRYQIEAVWRDFQGNAGSGMAAPLTADTGTFWFFDPANVEVVVKVLDGQSLNGHVWVFFGALSNVRYTLTVTDTQTGLSRQYQNPAGQFASVGDAYAFGPLGAYGTKPTPPIIVPPSPPPVIGERVERAAVVPCQASARRLCLHGGRFAVEVSWKDFQDRTGQGTAVPLSGDTGTFWFFDASNVELVVKALDGRPINGHFWLFYGALSNVEYTLTVTDTQTGTVRTYTNPKGRFASVGDTAAF
jgi:ELWxxDGT repeat protein